MKKIAEKFTKLTNIPCTSIKYLEGGLTNDNYLINDNYVLRSRKHFHIPGFDYKVENEVETKLFGKPYVLPLVAYEVNEGTKITKFLPNAVPFAAKKATKEVYQSIANILYDLHHSGIKVAKIMDIPKRIEEYKNSYPAQEKFNERLIIMEAERWLKEATLTLCHNDVVPGNILIQGEKIYLIDYEYAMMNDPFFDIVSFLSENDITDSKTQQQFLIYYYGKFAFWMEEKLLAYFAIFDLLWYHWAKMMYHFSSSEIYQIIAQSKEQRLLSYSQK